MAAPRPGIDNALATSMAASIRREDNTMTLEKLAAPRLHVALLLTLTLAGPRPLQAQTRLTLEDAVARAGAGNSDVRATLALEREARAREAQARAGRFPSVDAAESWQRGNEPAFVFGSLLAQGGFRPSTFTIDSLNHPSTLSDHRSVVTAAVPVFDPAIGASIRGAVLGVQSAAARREMVRHDLEAAVVAAYGAVVNALALRRVVVASLASANADLVLARHRRDQGLVTEADVLQVQLHVAATREREIRATADETVARVRLNQLMDAPLDATFVVDELLTSRAQTAAEPDGEALAVTSRPELRLATLNDALADAALSSARAAFVPSLSLTGTWEANGPRWDARTSGWVAGVVARVNLFRGFADRARVAEASERQRRSRVEHEQAETAVRVEVREAQARLDAARAAADVAEAAVAQAAESHRIVRDRYEAGLADVSALLRAAEGVQEAEGRRVTARVETLVAAAAWRRAVGR